MKTKTKMKTKTQNTKQTTKQNSNRYFSEKSPKLNKKDEKIFAIMVNTNNENTRKLLRKDNYEEIKDYFSKNVKTALSLKCALFTKDPTTFQNAFLF